MGVGTASWWYFTNVSSGRGLLRFDQAQGWITTRPEYLRNDHSRDLGGGVNAHGEGKTWQSNSRWSCGRCVPAGGDSGNFSRPRKPVPDRQSQIPRTYEVCARLV